MKIFGFIPSRYESSRFPGKPLANISGKPLVQRVYECSKACEELNEVYVATDDMRIYSCVEAFGGKAIMTSEDHHSGSDRIFEAAQKVGLNEDDIVVNIQGDQPFFSSSIIEIMIRPLLDDADIPMTTVKYRITNKNEIPNPNHVKVVADGQDFALYFSRSPIPYCRDEDRKQVYYKHLGFYAYRMGFLKTYTDLPESDLETAEKLEQLRVLEHGFKIKVIETPFDSVEVDVRSDIERVERLIEQSE